jgi:hypothetical protein
MEISMELNAELLNEYVESMNAEIQTLTKERILLRAQNSLQAKQIQGFMDAQVILQNTKAALENKVYDLENALKEKEKKTKKTTTPEEGF